MTTNLLLEKEFIPIIQRVFLRKEELPTMYDLPSEDPEEPGLPDDFHNHQPQLLSETFCPPDYSSERIYTASDLNLYYDVYHSIWYKRPDWFAVLGVPPYYQKKDEMRYSYVIWQEEVSPFIVVELLSESTKKEDLGQTLREVKKPPTKWQVYEQWLQIPYYVIYSRESENLQVFRLRKGRYRELELDDKGIWLPDIKLGLGVWNGTYKGFKRQWLRWYDARGKWISTPLEAEKEQREKAEQRANAQAKRAAAQAQARLLEKQRADAEAQARSKAEAELAQLKALLAEKGLSLD